MGKNMGDCIQEGTLVQTEPNGHEAGIDVELAAILKDATAKVFETMITEEFEFIDDAAVDPREVLSMVGIAGYMSGVLSIQCDRDAAVAIAAGMLGMEPDEVEWGADVLDAIGEVANIIAGNVKTELSREGDPLSLSVPTVVVGSEFQVETLSSGERMDLTVAACGFPLKIGLVIEQA